MKRIYYIGNHLLPEGGTEHTSTAAARHGFSSSSPRTMPMWYKLSQTISETTSSNKIIFLRLDLPLSTLGSAAGKEL